MSRSRSEAELTALAHRQWEDYRRGTPGTYFGEQGDPLTLRDAYVVQLKTARLRCVQGDTVVGYKVGCIGPGIVEQFGMSGPIYARLFGSEISLSGDALKLENYANLAIEGEMAVRVGSKGHIDAAFPIIELHNYVFRGTSKSLPELVANNGINAGIVLSSARAFRLNHWDDARVLAVEIDGATVDSGPLWAMKGGAREALEWLSAELAQLAVDRVNPGDLVLVGTALGLHRVRRGNHIAVLVDGRRYVECRIV
jgi:2-keto-4-pentenoate hydratase